MLAVTLMRSLELIRDGESRRGHLRTLIAQLRQQVKLGRWRLMPSQTAIQPLVIGPNDEAVAVSETLARDGLLIPAIRPPTVPQGTARLRISLTAAHVIEDVERLAAALNVLQ
jgi:8-amino-7-oxononanoate synthase